MNAAFRFKIFKFWFPVFFYSGIIFYVSSWQKVPVSPEIPFLDKFLHLLEYSGLGFLTARAEKATTGFSLGTIGWTAVLFCLLYGLSDEFHQMFVPTREVSLADVAADTLGGFLGTLMIIRRNT